MRVSFNLKNVTSLSFIVVLTISIGLVLPKSVPLILPLLAVYFGFYAHQQFAIFTLTIIALLVDCLSALAIGPSVIAVLTIYILFYLISEQVFSATKIVTLMSVFLATIIFVFIQSGVYLLFGLQTQAIDIQQILVTAVTTAFWGILLFSVFNRLFLKKNRL